MRRESGHQGFQLRHGKALPDELGEQKHLVGEHVHPQVAADPAAVTASQLDATIRKGRGIQRIEGLLRRPRSRVVVLRCFRPLQRGGKRIRVRFGHGKHPACITGSGHDNAREPSEVVPFACSVRNGDPLRTISLPRPLSFRAKDALFSCGARGVS